MSTTRQQPSTPHVVTVPISTPSTVLLPNRVTALEVPDQRPTPIPTPDVSSRVDVPVNVALQGIRNYSGLKTSINYKIEDIEGQPVRGKNNIT